MGGKASAASKNKWIAKAYDRVNLTLPKGMKEQFQAHAATQGESLNAFIKRAMEETKERDQQRPDDEKTPPPEAGSGT